MKMAKKTSATGSSEKINYSTVASNLETVRKQVVMMLEEGKYIVEDAEKLTGVQGLAKVISDVTTAHEKLEEAMNIIGLREKDIDDKRRKQSSKSEHR